MVTYKITNITDKLGKRHHSFNMTVKIKYVDSMINKSVDLKAGKSMFLTIESLPLSVHRLRVQGHVIVEELSKDAVTALTNKPKRKPKTQPKKTTKKVEKKVVTPKKSTTTKKKTENKSTVYLKDDKEE